MAEEAPPLIVGVDGSERSRDALALAAGLVEPGQRLLLVHVPGTASCRASCRRRSTRSSSPISPRRRSSRWGTPRPRTPREMRVVPHRSPAAGLHEIAAKYDDALVVVGSSEHSGLGRVLAGSTAESTLVGAPVPVAVAPRGYATAERALKTIGCGFDGSPESMSARTWAHALARRRGARLRALAVHTPIAFLGVPTDEEIGHVAVNDARRRSLEQQMRDATDSLVEGGRVEARIHDGDATSELATASSDLDLLVLGSRGHGPVRSVLLGSVSRALVRSAACPVVVLRRGAGGS